MIVKTSTWFNGEQVATNTIAKNVRPAEAVRAQTGYVAHYCANNDGPVDVAHLRHPDGGEFRIASRERDNDWVVYVTLEHQDFTSARN